MVINNELATQRFSLGTWTLPSLSETPNVPNTYFCKDSDFEFMLKSIIIELSTLPNEELLSLLKDSRKLLDNGGTIEIVSPTKMHIISLDKGGQSEEQALAESEIGKMIRTAGFKGSVSITRRGHMGGESTHIIAAA
jgi:hypothetical protein